MTAPTWRPDPWTLTAQIVVNDATRLTLADRPGDGCALGLGPLITVQLSQTAEDYLRHLLNVREGRRVAAARAERRADAARANLAAAVLQALGGAPPRPASQVVAFPRRPLATEPSP